MAETDDGIEQGHLGDTHTVVRRSDEEFAVVDVRGEHEIVIDEPEWLPMDVGSDEHPAPVDHLVVGLVSCQVEVLHQALERARVEDYEIEAAATIDDIGKADVPDGMPGNTAAVIEHIDVDLSVEVPEEDEDAARRALDVYDQGCIVGQSLRQGIEYTPRPTLETR